jgi:hypothetical protein
MTATPITPRAFDAIVSQLAQTGANEWTMCADINGTERDWVAFFDTEEDPYGGIDNRHQVCSTIRAKLIGAWCEDDDGNLYAGNRAELAEMIGQDEVDRWEREAEEGLNS